jgi:activator of HSP90 ATPase
MPLKFGTIVQVVFFDASPAEVYDALMDAKKHSKFTGSPATVNAKVGSEFNAWDGYITAKNIELVKDKKIVQEWETTSWPKGYPRSRLELTLTKLNGGTELRMVHANVPAEQVGSYTGGWTESYWDPLKNYLGKPEKKAAKKTKRKPSA